MPYGADSIAARLAATPDSPYLDYITSLAAGSIPIVRSTLTRVSELLYQCAPEKAPWHLMTAKEFNFLRHHLESQGFAPKTIHRTLSFVRSTLKRARQRDLIPESNVGQYAVIMATENVKGSTGRGEIAPTEASLTMKLIRYFDTWPPISPMPAAATWPSYRVCVDADSAGWMLRALRLRISGGQLESMGNYE